MIRSPFLKRASLIVSITHGDDTDGLTSAALLYRLFKAKVVLANYDDLEKILAEVASDVTHLYITDLNLREALLPQIQRIRGHAAVTLIDHHPMRDVVKTKLIELGVRVLHDTRDCASILVYHYFREMLDQDAARIASYAAITDMFEEGPIAAVILDHMDRKFAQHEALILNHALGCDQSESFKRNIVNSLASYAYPHQIAEAPETALKQLGRIVDMRRMIPEKTTRNGRLAYLECNSSFSTGEVANIIMDTLGVDVGMCYKIEEDSVNISLRGERRLAEHLGEVLSKLSEKYGGFGGGHNRAAGAKIPKKELNAFILDLGRELNH